MSSHKGCIRNTTEENWNSEKQKGVKEKVGKLEKSGREVEERIDKDNMLKSKQVWDQHYSLPIIKRLESHYSTQGKTLGEGLEK